MKAAVLRKGPAGLKFIQAAAHQQALALMEKMNYGYFIR